MLSSLGQSVAQQLDRLALYSLLRRVPDSLESSYQDAPSLENVMAQTRVDFDRTVEYGLSSPGEHRVWLDSSSGEMCCFVRSLPAADPSAPLILYHHGLNEVPYDNSWRRIFRRDVAFPAHCVCVQAPFHTNWRDPVSLGFASVGHIYQTFAGSMRLLELMQNHFERQGAAFTVVAGVSWGGVTSLLYESFFQRARAVIPMLAGPDLAQVLWDTAERFNRPLTISRQQVDALFDFTPYYRRCDPDRVFPLLGEADEFFQYSHQTAAFATHPIMTIPDAHVTGTLRKAALRQHILTTLAIAASQTR